MEAMACLSPRQTAISGYTQELVPDLRQKQRTCITRQHYLWNLCYGPEAQNIAVFAIRQGAACVNRKKKRRSRKWRRVKTTTPNRFDAQKAPEAKMPPCISSVKQRLSPLLFRGRRVCPARIPNFSIQNAIIPFGVFRAKESGQAFLTSYVISYWNCCRIHARSTASSEFCFFCNLHFCTISQQRHAEMPASVVADKGIPFSPPLCMPCGRRPGV